MGIYNSKKIIRCKDTGEVVTGDMYLTSKHWKELRVKVYNLYNGRCQRCGQYFPLSKINVHHRIYSRIGNEKMSDLVLYCGHCHSCVHSKVPKKMPKKINLTHLITHFLTLDEQQEAVELIIKHFSLDVELIEKERNEQIQRRIDTIERQRKQSGCKKKR